MDERLVSENDISASDLIQPIFIRDGKKRLKVLKQCQVSIDIQLIDLM